MSQSLLIQSWDPLVFGDGRPFAQDAGAQLVKTLNLPLPSTLAGALRTTFALRERGGKFDPDELVKLAQRGPLLVVDNQLQFPTPSDLVLVKKTGTEQDVYARSSPLELQPGEGTDLPSDLRPCLLDQVDVEPTKTNGPHWLSLEEMTTWLTDRKPPSRTEDTFGIPQESRVHVGIAPSTLASLEGALFETRSVHLGPTFHTINGKTRDHELGIATAPDEQLSAAFGEATALTLGGERRVALARRAESDAWSCPAKIRESLTGANRIRMILATPASFAGGLRPGWTTPPGSNVKLRLVGVANRRYQHVSGWDIAKGRPKPVRWLAPAGAVYFFELESGNPAELADHWLQPVSDDEQSRRDGFGLALWGTW